MGKEAGKNKAESVLDKAMLARLTSNIDQNLLKSADAHSVGKRKHQDGSANEPNPKKCQVQAVIRGNKRNRYGKKKKAKEAGEDNQSVLLQEIRALGGDENDLELVAGIDSSDDYGLVGHLQGKADEEEVDDVLKSDIVQFASILGFQKLPQDYAVGTDEEDETDVDDDQKSGKEGKDEDVKDISESKKQANEDIDEHESREEDQPSDADMASERGKKTIFEPRPDWHEFSLANLPSSIPDDIDIFSSVLKKLKEHAKGLLEEDSKAFKAMQARSRDAKFMVKLIAAGTLADKVSALTLAIQESPLHNVRNFETLLALAGKRIRGQGLTALGALVDLLGNGLVLPKNRRLRFFDAQPGLLGSLHKESMTSWHEGQKLPKKVTQAHIVMWAYEDWLKDAYFRVVQLLEAACNDTVEHAKSRAVDFVFGLLRDKPEQEANLLRLLVNKLGDRDRKIASRASFLLLQLLTVHPGMKSVLINVVELEVLLRPGQTLRAKNYAINTLNQTILSSNEPATADNLVRIYFDVFMSLLKTGSLGALDTVQGSKGPSDKDKKVGQPSKAAKQDQDAAQKLVSSLLTGVNRALPFTAADDQTLEQYLDTLFRITHSSNFNTSVQALMLIWQFATTKQLAMERFYRTLYESLLDPRLTTSSKQVLYLNLLIRSLKSDVDVRRVKAFVKRMLQIINLHQPPFTCGVLFLVAELESTFPDLKTLLNVPENDDDENGQSRDLAPADAKQSPGGRSRAYDGRKRDPKYSNADKSCLWELVPFFSHFHPSVVVLASNLLVRQNKIEKPELANLALMHFLDKFVNRHPKAADAKRGVSIMQPTTSAVKLGETAAGPQTIMHSVRLWNIQEEQVAAEDVFFHKYYAQFGKPRRKNIESKKGKKAEPGRVDGEEKDEDEIWDAMVNSRPELPGDEGDVDLDGFGESDLHGFDYSDDDDSVDFGSDEKGGADAQDFDSDAGGVSDGCENILSDSEGGDNSDEHGQVFVSEQVSEKDGKEVVEKPRRTLRAQQQKKIKALPMFASVDDYADMLKDEEDGL